jgi:hypothetical protein
MEEPRQQLSATQMKRAIARERAMLRAMQRTMLRAMLRAMQRAMQRAMEMGKGLQREIAMQRLFAMQKLFANEWQMGWEVLEMSLATNHHQLPATQLQHSSCQLPIRKVLEQPHWRPFSP